MPISAKQKKILAFPYTNFDALIADGAIRSGKTVFMTLSFIDDAMRRFNGQRFGICGKTVCRISTASWLSMAGQWQVALYPACGYSGWKWTSRTVRPIADLLPCQLPNRTPPIRSGSVSGTRRSTASVCVTAWSCSRRRCEDG